MANPEHLEILKQGKEVWNRWRMNNPSIIPNLSEANLTFFDLSGYDLNSCVLAGTNLGKANLKEAYLANANLFMAHLQLANLESANLIKTNLKEADCEEANLEEANLGLANLRGINLKRANLQKTNLQDADLKDANLERANLYKADMREANLIKTNLKEANLEEANLEGTNLYRANLKGTILETGFQNEAPTSLSAFESGTSLKRARFHKANLKGTILETKPLEKVSISIPAFERDTSSKLESMKRDLERQIEEVRNTFAHGNPQLKENIEEKISQKLDELINENLVKKVGEETQKLTSDFTKKEAISQIISDGYARSKTRYGDYADKSEKEAEDYRKWGIAIAIAGLVTPLIVLIYILIAQYPNLENWQRIFIATPITLTFEAIAFILLSMSNKATERMRSFSIEACNLDLQSAGYLSMIQVGENSEIQKSLVTLSTSERPLVLKKDERTIEEAHNQSHIEFMKNITDAIKPIMTADANKK